MRKVVIETEPTTVSLDDLNEGRTYAFRHSEGRIHVLKHCRVPDKWWWYHMDTTGGHCGSHESMRAAIEARIKKGDEVFEFSGQEDFIDWAKKQIEK